MTGRSQHGMDWTQELLSRSSSSCDYGDYEVVFNKNHVYV